MSKKFVINLGFARSGTTTLHQHFSENPLCSVPKEEKEIKSFLNDLVTKDEYLDNFCHEQAKVIFESSPPYSHAGIDSFRRTLRNVKRVLLTEDVHLVFNIREPISRALSHYWYDIGKHHSVFGKRWRVNSRKDRERFAEVFDLSFFDCLKYKNYKNSLFPKYYQIIKEAIEQFGEERVNIIHLDEIDNATKILFEKLDIKSQIVTNLKTNSYVKPVYYRSNANSIFEIRTIDHTYLVKVPSNHILFLSENGAELINGEEYDIGEVSLASLNWSHSIDARIVRKRLEKYFQNQVYKISEIPDACFIGDSKSIFMNSLNQDKVHYSKDQCFNFDLESVNGIEILAKCERT